MSDYDNTPMLEAINECVHNAVHREVLRLRLVDGMTYERIAGQLKISPRQVGYIMAKYTPTLYKRLGV